MKKVYRQINNLKIVHDDNDPDSPWVVKAPDGRVLEEFIYLNGAINFAIATLDFTKRGKDAK